MPPARIASPAFLASASVTGAAVNVAVSLAPGPPGLAQPAALVGALAWTAATVGLAVLALEALAAGLGRLRPAAVPALRGGLLATLLGVCAVGPFLLAGSRPLLAAAAVAALAALGAFVGRRTGSGTPAPGWQAALPWLALAVCAAAWLRVPDAPRGAVAGALAFALAGAVVALLTRRRALCGAALVLVLAAPGLLAAPGALRSLLRPEATGRGAVILLSVDTLRADVLRAFSPKAPAHPNLDALLAESVVFTRAYTPSPWTKPAVASALTGLSPRVHRATSPEAALPPQVETLAERLAAAGYQTAAVGRNVFLSRQFGFQQGFDRYLFAPELAPGLSWGALARRLVRGAPRAVTSDALTDRAIAWLRREPRDPFLLWVHYFDPHAPYDPPARHAPTGPPPPRIGSSGGRANDIRAGRFDPTPEERRWIRALYDGEVRWVDENVGRLVAALRELGLYDDATIVFWSDHGEEFWEHGGFEHGHSVHDELLHVPLAVRLPGGANARSVDVPVSLASVFATAAELAGAATGADGPTAPSLVPLWTEPGAQGPEAIESGFLLYGGPQEALLIDGMKLTLGEDGPRAYDLARDPEERDPLPPPPALTRRARVLLHTTQQDAARARTKLGIEEAPAVAPDQETTERLRALGYVD